jgi:hypothetical protein
MMVTSTAVRFYRDVEFVIRSDESTNGRPTLPNGHRSLIQRTLERILVNRLTLKEHVRYLQRRLSAFRHDDLLSAELMEGIMQNRLSPLNDDTLASMLINPIGLDDLSECIDTRLPDAWIELMLRDGREEMKRAKIYIPSGWREIAVDGDADLRTGPFHPTFTRESSRKINVSLGNRVKRTPFITLTHHDEND